MRLLLLTALLVLPGCRNARVAAMSDQQHVEPAPEPDTTKKISGTVISFGKHPNLNYQYSVLTYLDDDGMLRTEAFIGPDITADLSKNNLHARRVRISAPLHEGDRFRMTRDAYGNYDIVKSEEEM